MPSFLIGIDLGGTNLRCALVDENQKIIARYETDTRAEQGPDAIVERLATGVEDVLRQKVVDRNDVLVIGLAAPGPLDGRNGIVLKAPNMPGWENYPVAEKLRAKTGLRVFLENDANAAGWGEYVAGAGRGCENMVLMTLGTGVGGAIIINGQMLHGPDWTAGEIGHVVVVDGGRVCGCGGKGCLEAYASATATVRRFTEARKQGWQTSLNKEIVTCADIFDTAKGGDNLAKHIVAETGRYLGLMAANMANLLNSERCIFSGGMIKGGDLLFDAIRKACAEHAFPAPGKRLEILPAQLGSDAGLIGAAGCALVALGCKSI